MVAFGRGGGGLAFLNFLNPPKCWESVGVTGCCPLAISEKKNLLILADVPMHPQRTPCADGVVGLGSWAKTLLLPMGVGVCVGGGGGVWRGLTCTSPGGRGRGSGIALIFLERCEGGVGTGLGVRLSANPCELQHGKTGQAHHFRTAPIQPPDGWRLTDEEEATVAWVGPPTAGS